MSFADGPPFPIALACGFTPLHLQTFLVATIWLTNPNRPVAVQTGLYGDCLGNLERVAGQPREAAALVLEWSDLDPRLGLRALSGWLPGSLADILRTVRASLEQFRAAAHRLAAAAPLAISLPSLPLPPVSYTPGWLSSQFELRLRESLLAFAASAAELGGVRIVNPQWLDAVSPPGCRLDVQAELLSGFPYTLSHTAALAEQLARLILPPAPKKALITDLDDTLWRGLLGEIGQDAISWHLDQHSHGHGLYQQLLRSLAEAGVLIGVASKNDPGLVMQALGRSDLVLRAQDIFPIEASWGPKSTTVGRILRAWNLSADSVVFVDDSPLELAEVQAAYPEMTCLSFPTRDNQAITDLLVRLRNLFGKQILTAEDALRRESLRRQSEIALSVDATPVDHARMLEEVEARLTVSFEKDVDDPRTLELINKTNQFNLNGRRFTEASWRAFLNEPETFLVRVSYEDKFGPLGTISVLGGRQSANALAIATWVMSCRAFSRRIEHHCLALLFERFQAETLVFDFQETPRNGPLRDFLGSFAAGWPLGPGFRIARQMFFECCPPLPHRVQRPSHA